MLRSDTESGGATFLLVAGFTFAFVRAAAFFAVCFEGFTLFGPCQVTPTVFARPEQVEVLGASLSKVKRFSRGSFTLVGSATA